ncbi:ABC transporter substrate-binding protein [Dictyobacter aurantiacus]|uniref:ABC transporter substrate-binding protein n=1 Tax=Dictyobacter aurantiacus TaxID=1936993 RepID=A0A401ZIF1_9CHLR|nr:ABC transporter substrate-binding protein [Dictyobacter aurantiacus]GCE06614.1 ABC transporter substrate-binding protein [Dictyobacter aurantiacus]
MSALMLTILTVVLSACGGSTGSTSSTGQGGSNGSCSNVQLTFWNALSGPDGPVVQQLVTQYNSSHPDSKVKMSIIPLNNFATKLDTAAASKTLPDVAIINEDQIATQAFRNVISPIDDVMPKIGYSANDFPARAWSQDEVAGKRYGIPLFINPMTMYYNADLLQKAGISNPPTNDAEFQKAAAAMNTGGKHGFQITTGFPVQQIFQQLLHQFGGSEFNADNTQATWNSPAGVKALQWMKDAQAKYSQPKLPVDADVNSFKAGNVGMIWNGIWQDTNVTGDAVEFKGQAAATPQIGSQPATWAGMGSLTIPSSNTSSCTRSAAATFIKYVVDNSAKMAQGGDMPALRKARNDASVQNIPLMKSLSQSVENPVFPPSVPGISDAFTPLGNAIGAIMAGTSQDVQKSLDTSVNQANQILKQNQQKYGSTPKK